MIMIRALFVKYFFTVLAKFNLNIHKICLFVLFLSVTDNNICCQILFVKLEPLYQCKYLVTLEQLAMRKGELSKLSFYKTAHFLTSKTSKNLSAPNSLNCCHIPTHIILI